MTWWIAGGVIVAAFMVLAFAAGALLASLGRLARTVKTIQNRVGGSGLQDRLAALEQRVETLQAPVLVTQERLAVLQAHRGRS